MQEMGSRYLFIVLYVFLEHHLSRGDYRHRRPVSVAIVTGSGGLIGSESCRRLIEAGLDVIGIENDMRSALLRPRGLDRARSPPSSPRPSRVSPRSSSTSATPSGDRAALRRPRGRDRGRRPHAPPSPPTTGPRASRRPTSRVNANGTLNLLEAARAALPRRARSSSARPTRSTATPPTGCRSSETETRLELARVAPLLRRHRHLDVDRSLHPLAVRRLEGGRRPAGAGVRALLRDADRLLSRRLPDRPAARRRAAARLPRLPDEVRRHRHALHRVRLRRQAGARQHPLRRPGRRVRGLRADPRPAAVYNIGGGRQLELLDARGDRGLRADRRPRAGVGARPRAADRRPSLVDLRPGAVSRPTIRTGRLRYGIEEILARDPRRATSSAGPPRPAERAVVGAHPRAGCGDRLAHLARGAALPARGAGPVVAGGAAPRGRRPTCTRAASSSSPTDRSAFSRSRSPPSAPPGCCPASTSWSAACCWERP